MRSFYTNSDGRTANLCLLLDRKSTRLTIYDNSGKETHRTVYLTWDDAISSLRSFGPGWTNDLTHAVL